MSDALRDHLQATLGQHYDLEREIGGGGMSRVFVAQEKALGRKVVVKVLPPDLAAAVSVERFKREIQLAARLQHPHIVPVLAAGEVDGLPYYTMPLVRGESLRARLQREGELPISESIRILHDVAAALAHAHEEGVVHRDIKPDNVMLTGGEAVVTDLGVGKAVDLSVTDSATRGRDSGLTSMGVALGTPAYMSPEQAAADPNVDHRADIYSLGCVAYEMLTGATPFATRNAPQMLAAHMAEAAEPVERRRESTPPALAMLVMRCLAKRPADRPQSAGEVMSALEGLMSSGSTAAALPVAVAGGTSLQRALTWFFAAAFVVVTLAYAATEFIGLPSWVPLGGVIVMAMGLPPVLLTGWIQKRAAGPTVRDSVAARVGRHVSWRRTTLGGVGAVGAFVLVVVAYMATRALGIGPAASLSAAGKLDRNQKVLVAEFTARGADSSLAMLAAEAVRTDLAQSSALFPMRESELSAVLRLMSQPDTARVDLALARNIAQREGVRAIVTGDITPLPDNEGMVVALRLLAAESGDELAAYRETIDGASGLIPALGRLSKTLRAKAGESLKSVRATPPLERVTTSSLEALREYVLSQRANRGLQPRVAIEHLRKAIAADSLFAIAWTSLGVNLRNAGMSQIEADSALQRAYELRGRLSQNEQYRVATSYFGQGPGRNRAEAARLFEEWLRKDTAGFVNSTGAHNFATNLMSRRQYQRAAEILGMMREANLDLEIQQDPMISATFAQGKFEEAAALVKRAREKFPGMVHPANWDAAFLYQRGQWDSVEAFVTRYRRENAGRNAAAPVNAIRGLATLVQMRGRLAESVRLEEEARMADLSRGARPAPWTLTLNRATGDIWFREQPERGVNMLDSVLKEFPISAGNPGTRPYERFARLYALAGRSDRAREIMRLREGDLDSLALREGISAALRVAGEIEFFEGRPLEAIKLWRKSDTLPDGPSPGCPICLYADLGRGFLKANLPDSAIYWFEKYLETPYFIRSNVTTDGTYLPVAYKALGELYEGKGDRVKARDYYQRFVKLWEKADADLQPVVKSVAERIRRLSGEPPPP